MGFLFSTAKQTNSVSPKYTQIPIQTSCYGNPVPIGYGTSRVAGNLVDYFNFQTHAVVSHQSSSGGGKGGSATPATTSYTYSADLMFAIAEGPVLGVGDYWSGNAIAGLNTSDFTLFAGTLAQPTWGELSAVNPGHSLNYSNTVLLNAANYNLGTSPNLPNFNFELVFNGSFPIPGFPDSTPDFVAKDLLTNQFFGIGFPPNRCGQVYTINENHTVPSSGPFTVSAGASSGTVMFLNLSVSYISSGTLLTAVASNPGPGQYTVSFGTGFDQATYTFSAADAGQQVNIQCAGNSQSFDTYRQFAAASLLLISPFYNSQQQASQMLDQITKLTYSEWVWTTGVLTIVPRGAAAVAAYGFSYSPSTSPLFNLTDDDLVLNQSSVGGTGFSVSNDPVIVTRKRPADQINDVKLEFLDRANQYAASIAEAFDQALIDKNGRRPSQNQSAHIFCNATSANISAVLQLQDQHIMNSYTFTVDERYCVLDPMDLVTVPAPESPTPESSSTNIAVGVRLLKTQENQDGTISMYAEEYPGTLGAVALYLLNQGSGFAANFNASAPVINPPVFMALPLALTGGVFGLSIAVSGQGGNQNNFGGCQVWISQDGSTYKLASPQTINSPSRMGVLTAVLPAIAEAVSGPTIDTTNTLTGDFSESNATFTSGTAADMQNGNTLLFVDGEIMAYQTATLISGPNTYKFSTLNRGLFNSPITQHAIGAPVVRLDSLPYTMPLTNDRLGQVLFLKFVPFNPFGGGLGSLSNAVAYETVLNGPAPPPDVTGFSAVQSFVDVIFRWNAVDDEFVAGYVIKYCSAAITPSWNSMLQVLQTSGTTAKTTIIPPGLWTVSIRAVDGLGQLSADMTSLLIFVVNYDVIVIDSPQAPQWPGVSTGWVEHFSGALLYDSAVLANTDTGTAVFDNYVWQPVARADYVSPLFTIVKDITFTAYANIVAVAGPGILTDINPQLFISYGVAPTTDPPMWTTDASPMWSGDSNEMFATQMSDWFQWTKGAVTTAAISYRLTAFASDGLPVIQQFEPIADQPAQQDGNITGVPVSIAVGGSNITFNNENFIVIPSVTVTPVGTTGLSGVASNITTEGFTAQILNSSGTDVGGLANWQAFGKPQPLPFNFPDTSIFVRTPAGASQGVGTGGSSTPAPNTQGWNVNDSSGLLTISGAALVATHTSGTLTAAAVRTVRTLSPNKIYFELTPTVIGNAAQYSFGIANGTFPLSDSLGQDANSIGWFSNGTVISGGSTITTIENYTAGNNPTGIAIDYVNRLMWCRFVTSGAGTNTFATINPADKSANLTLSGGNDVATLGATGAGSFNAARANVSAASGKFYCEAMVSGGGASLAIDSNDTGHHSTTSPLTWSFTNTAGNKVLVGIEVTNSGTTPPSISSVTYGGQTMTLQKSVTYASGASSNLTAIYALDNAPTGANTVSISFSGASSIDCIAGAQSMTGADGIGTTASNTGGAASTVATVTLSTTTNGSLIFTMAGTGTHFNSANSPQTSEFILNVSTSTSGDNGAAGTIPGTGGSVSPSWSIGTDLFGMVAVEVLPAAKARIGYAPSTLPLTGNAPGDVVSGTNQGVGITATGGAIFGGVNQNDGTFKSGDVIGLAVDATNKKFWWKNITQSSPWHPSGDPNTGTGGLSISASGFPLFPALADFFQNDAVTFKFDSSTFSGTLPTGYSAFISGTSGSGSMVVGPWNAGFATVTTWDPANTQSSNNLTGANLTLTKNTSSNGPARSLAQITSKTHWEITISVAGGAATDYNPGLCNGSMAISSAEFLGKDTNSVGYNLNGNVLYNNATLTTIETAAQGNTLVFEFDPTAKLLWIANGSGNWNNSGTANPATGVGGISLALAGPYYAAWNSDLVGNAGVANFGASAFVRTPSSGFAGLILDPTGQSNDPGAFLGGIPFGAIVGPHFLAFEGQNQNDQVVANFGGSPFFGGLPTGYISANAAIAAPPPPPPNLVTPSYYVATNGSDSNDGLTTSTPFATLGKAQTAMQSSSVKHTYLRAGTYSLGSPIALGSSDNGTTWAYFPNDGPNTAVLDGGNSTQYAFNGNGCSTVTIDGIKMQNFTLFGPAFGASSGCTSCVVQHCEINNCSTTGHPGAANSAGALFGDNCNFCSFINNYVHDQKQGGISITAFAGGSTNKNIQVKNNVFLRCATALSDNGVIYLNSHGGIGQISGAVIVNNFIRDWGSNALTNDVVGIYLDDLTSGCTVTGNIVGPPAVGAITVNDRNNTGAFLLNDDGNTSAGGHTITGNIIDLGTSGFVGVGLMLGTNNVFANNIIVSHFTGNQQTSDSGIIGFSYYGDSNTNTNHNNLYFNYGGGQVVTTGHNFPNDANPTIVNPQFVTGRS